MEMIEERGGGPGIGGRARLVERGGGLPGRRVRAEPDADPDAAVRALDHLEAGDAAVRAAVHVDVAAHRPVDDVGAAGRNLAFAQRLARLDAEAGALLPRRLAVAAVEHAPPRFRVRRDLAQ